MDNQCQLNEKDNLIEKDDQLQKNVERIFELESKLKEAKKSLEKHEEALVTYRH